MFVVDKSGVNRHYVKLMQKAWSPDPHERPTMSDIEKNLTNIILRTSANRMEFRTTLTQTSFLQE